MLFEFEAKNWRSLDRAALSLVATEDERMRNAVEFIDEHEATNRTIELIGDYDPDMLTTAAIFGANASGKSNFISALKFIKKIVVYPWHGEPCIEIPMNIEKPISFTLSMFANKIMLEFKLSIIKKTECYFEIVKERLYRHHHDSLDVDLLYKRDGNNLKIHNSIAKDKIVRDIAANIQKSQIFLPALNLQFGIQSWFDRMVFLSGEDREQLLKPEDKLYIVDDLNLGYHPILTRHLINQWFSRKPPTAQLIFTTHDAMLMDSRLFRFDELWIMDKHKKSSLYSLAKIKDIEKDEDVRRSYLQGKFGGIPHL